MTALPTPPNMRWAPDLRHETGLPVESAARLSGGTLAFGIFTSGDAGAIVGVAVGTIAAVGDKTVVFTARPTAPNILRNLPVRGGTLLVVGAMATVRDAMARAPSPMLGGTLGFPNGRIVTTGLTKSAPAATAWLDERMAARLFASATSPERGRYRVVITSGCLGSGDAGSLAAELCGCAGVFEATGATGAEAAVPVVTTADCNICDVRYDNTAI